MVTRKTRKEVKHSINKFIDFVTYHTDICFFDDITRFNKNIRYCFMIFDDKQIVEIIKEWKYYVISTKQFISCNVKNYILSEIRRGEI